MRVELPERASTPSPIAGMPGSMRVTVVINTYNRAAGLRITLAALRHQTYESFEVVVVNGPSTDDTEDVLRREDSDLTIARCPEPHLTKSRNVGLAAARGEIVAFIDDDAIPEPTWIAALVRGYEAARVGGVGGFVLDDSGMDFQWRHAGCTRLGVVRKDVTPPLAALVAPGADPFLYLQGTNCSFRRACLVEIGGFDEGLEHYYDDADVAARVIDCGYELRVRPDALVHHKTLRNRTRDQAQVIVSPRAIMADHAYFALRHGRRFHSFEEIRGSIDQFADGLCAAADGHVLAGRLTREQHGRFMQEVTDGMAAGLARGTTPADPPCVIPAPAGAFRPYRVRQPAGPRLHVCLLSTAAPSDRARAVAAEGHVVRLVTVSTAGSRVDFEDGVWIHRLAPWTPWIPELDAVPLRSVLCEAAAAYHEVSRTHERMPVDMVAAEQPAAASLCVLDERFPTALTVADTVALASPNGSSGAAAERAALERATMARASAVAADLSDPLAAYRAIIAAHGVDPAARGVRTNADADPEMERRHAVVIAPTTDHSAAVAHRFAAVIAATTGLDDAVAARAARRLVDRSAFPRDHLAECRTLWARPDDDFVGGLHRLLLGRHAGEAELAPHVASLLLGGRRIDVVRSLAGTAEARARGLPTAWIESLADMSTALPPVSDAAGARRRAVASWVRQRPRLARYARYLLAVLRLPWQAKLNYDLGLENQRELAEQRRALQELRAVVESLADKSHHTP